MPGMAAITLNNYAAAPVTYSVIREDSGIAVWADTSQGTPGGFRTVTQQIFRPNDPTKGTTRVRMFCARPFVNATTGLVDYIGRANTEFWIPVAATLAERQELYAVHKNYAAHANALAATVSLEGMF